MISDKSKVITYFETFEEMDAARACEAASIDPVESLRATVALILRVYGINREELMQRSRSNTITITRSA